MSFLRPTLKDVAKLSGVSEISVSRVMRDAPNISSRLREKVEEAAQILHYTPNKVAGALASNTTDLIGVVIPTIKRVEYTEILSGIESALGQSKYRMMLGITDFSVKREIKVINDFLAWSPSGVIMVGAGYSADARQLIQRSKAQCVEISNGGSRSLGLGLRVVYKNACMDLISHWQRLGVKNVAYVGTSEEQSFSCCFKEIFITQLDSANMTLVCEVATQQMSAMTSSVALYSELLRHTPKLDAIFFGDGGLVVGASFYNSLRESDKVAIASFNSSSQVDSSHATIDLINVNFEAVGAHAANFLSCARNDNNSMLKETVDLHAAFVRSRV